MKGRAMGFLSFVGRVLFAFLFIFSAYKDANDFGTDGGPAAKSWEPKLNLFIEQVSNRTGMAVPYVEIKAFIAATFYLRVLGGGLLILDTKLGAGLLLFYLLSIIPVMIVYHSYTIERNSPQYVQLCFRSLKNIVFYIALYGAMLFFCGMKYDEELEDRRLLEKRRATRTKRRKTKTKTN